MAIEEHGPRRVYSGLDGLRGVAAFMVVLFHGKALVGRAYAPGGYLAVDLFFALSGFVIAHAYDAQIATGMTRARFMVIRILRFWPLYALGLGFGLIDQLLLKATGNSYAMSSQQLALTVLLGLVLLPSWAGPQSNMYPLNIPSWSLFLELLVNIGYAASFRHVGQRALAVFAGLGAISVVVACLSHGSCDLGALFQDFPAGVARTLFSFCTGMLIYRSGWRLPGVPAGLLMLFVAAAMALPVAAAVRPWFDIAFVLVVSPLTVAAGAGSEPGSRWARLYRFLGLLSFPVYAVHRPLLQIAKPIAARLHAPAPLLALVTVIGLAVLAAPLDSWYDRPLRKALTHKFGLRRDLPLPEASLP